ncbi:MAG: hypothetical protein ACJAZS_000707 [Alteromonas naphthalenivorans]|jgi:hypothetical protein
MKKNIFLAITLLTVSGLSAMSQNLSTGLGNTGGFGGGSSQGSKPIKISAADQNQATAAVSFLRDNQGELYYKLQKNKAAATFFKNYQLLHKLNAEIQKKQNESNKIRITVQNITTYVQRNGKKIWYNPTKQQTTQAKNILKIPAIQTILANLKKNPQIQNFSQGPMSAQQIQQNKKYNTLYTQLITAIKPQITKLYPTYYAQQKQLSSLQKQQQALQASIMPALYKALTGKTPINVWEDNNQKLTTELLNLVIGSPSGAIPDRGTKTNAVKAAASIARGI